MIGEVQRSFKLHHLGGLTSAAAGDFRTRVAGLFQSNRNCLGEAAFCMLASFRSVLPRNQVPVQTRSLGVLRCQFSPGMFCWKHSSIFYIKQQPFG